MKTFPNFSSISSLVLVNVVNEKNVVWHLSVICCACVRAMYIHTHNYSRSFSFIIFKLQFHELQSVVGVICTSNIVYITQMSYNFFLDWMILFIWTLLFATSKKNTNRESKNLAIFIWQIGGKFLAFFIHRKYFKLELEIDQFFKVFHSSNKIWAKMLFVYSCVCVCELLYA